MQYSDKKLKYSLIMLDNTGMPVCPLFKVIKKNKMCMGYFPMSDDHENPTLKYCNLYITEYKRCSANDVIINKGKARQLGFGDVVGFKTDVVVACTDAQFSDIIPGIDEDFVKKFVMLFNEYKLIKSVELSLIDNQITGKYAKVLWYHTDNVLDRVDTSMPIGFYDDTNKTKFELVSRNILYEDDEICLCIADISDVDTGYYNRQLRDIKKQKTVLVRSQQYEAAAKLRDEEHQLLTEMEGLDKKGHILFSKKNGEVLNKGYEFWYAKNIDEY